MPLDPVSTLTWSIVWQFDVPGAQSVTLTKGTLAEPPAPEGPLSTMRGATLLPLPPPELLPLPPPLPELPTLPPQA
jgi:hypothetical protein